MFYHIILILLIVLLDAIQECHAAPNNLSSYISNSQTYEILKAIVLGYLAHIMTIRPRPDTDQKKTIYWRFASFAYPTLGIGIALKAMLMAYDSDRILGIDQINKQIEEIEGKKEHWMTEWKNDCWDSVTSIFSHKRHGTVYCDDIENQSFSNEPLIMDNREREDIDDKKLWENGSKAFREKVMALKEKIIKKYHANLQETNGDNVIYLAAILYTMNPQQARRTKHCILNESIYLGLDLPPRKLPQYPTLIMSKDISITGTGVDSTYQASVKPYAVRYLTENMLDQIPATHYMDDTSYIELSVTIVQLVNIVVECIDEDGDKWVKVVMIIYTIMSVLQTLSLMILHKQSMVLSILYERDTNSETPATLNASDNMRSNSNTRVPDRSPTATNGSDLQHKDAFLERIINKADIKTKDSFKVYTEYKYWSYSSSGIAGLAISLLVGIWADYTAHSITQWIVLAWILNPLILIFLAVIQKIIFKKHRFLSRVSVYLVHLIGISGALCVLFATIIGYNIKIN